MKRQPSSTAGRVPCRSAVSRGHGTRHSSAGATWPAVVRGRAGLARTPRAPGQVSGAKAGLHEVPRASVLGAGQSSGVGAGGRVGAGEGRTPLQRVPLSSVSCRKRGGGGERGRTGSRGPCLFSEAHRDSGSKADVDTRVHLGRGIERGSRRLGPRARLRLPCDETCFSGGKHEPPVRPTRPPLEKRT